MSKLTNLGARRLLRLAKILDTADALHKKRGERPYYQGAIIHPCGTPACAIGHYAAHTPSRFRVNKRDESVSYLPSTILDDHEARIAQAEFGISFDEGIEVFGWSGCGKARTAKQAAKYIRSFVRRKGVES